MTDPHYPLQGFRILPATELFDQDERVFWGGIEIIVDSSLEPGEMILRQKIG